MRELLDLLPVVLALALAWLVLWAAERLPHWVAHWSAELDRRQIARLARRMQLPDALVVTVETLTDFEVEQFREEWARATGRASAYVPVLTEQFLVRRPDRTVPPAQCTATSIGHQHRCPNPAAVDGLCTDCHRTYEQLRDERTAINSGGSLDHFDTAPIYLKWDQN